MALDDLIPTAEACRILGDIDRSTLSRWVQIGRIKPAGKLDIGPKGAFVFARADVEQLRDELAEAKSA